jgi:hypothetical protein
MACRAPSRHAPRRRLPAPSREMPARISSPASRSRHRVPRSTWPGNGRAGTHVRRAGCVCGVWSSTNRVPMPVLPDVSSGRKSHACSSLLSRAPSANLDRSHVRPCPGDGRELVRRHPRPQGHSRPARDPPCRPPGGGRRSADRRGTPPCRGTIQPCLTCNKARLAHIRQNHPSMQWLNHSRLRSPTLITAPDHPVTGGQGTRRRRMQTPPPAAPRRHRLWLAGESGRGSWAARSSRIMASWSGVAGWA